MSDIARESRPQFGFLSVVGLFFLTILAVLVALYFYNADVRQAGDGAMDQARAYKRTIATDYARFYECMRGVAPADAAQSPRNEGGETIRASTGKPSAPIAVYPPYADYPTYPTYPGMGGGPRGGMPAEPGAAAMHEQQLPIGTYPQGPDYPQQSMADPAAPGGPAAQDMAAASSMPPPAMMQPGPSMQAGPVMEGGGPSMQPGGGMQAGPMTQAGPAMGQGPSMQPGPMMGQGPAMQPGPMMGQRAMPPQGGNTPPGWGASGLPEYAQRPTWQAQGMTPPGMPPAGMVAPMPYGQGSSMPPMGQPGMAAPAPHQPRQAYGAPGQYPTQGAPAPYGAAPAAQETPAPYSGYGPTAGSTPYGQQSVPTVIAATPTLPMTSMMPPAGDTPPALPAAASQTDPQIIAARQAYANQQLQDAIGIYRAYIARNGSDPSAFGELGNVLLAAGRPQEAAQAYYEAASRLIDVGQPGNVYLLLPHIEQHDPLLGAVLMRRLASLPRSIY